MTPTHSSRTLFLSRYCPNPPLIQAAIQRLGLWDIREVGPDQFVCHAGDKAEACWIIVSGRTEIRRDDEHVTFREAGEMIGEQAFLTTLLGKEVGRRTADIVARGPLKLVCFDASLQEKFTPEEQAAWCLTLAAVVNEKLEQATRQRAGFRRDIAGRNSLLGRFAEGDALGVVLKAIEEKSDPVVNREVIVWFSDIANFSTWTASKSPEEVARIVRALTGCQIELIRSFGGHVDKLMGDGVMAVWFLGTAERRRTLPTMALECARKAADEIGELLRSEKLDGQMGIRIGLHSGQACFGDFGARQRIAVTVLSKDVNLASRYEQAKGDDLGPIRVSPPLKQLVEDAPSGSDWAFGTAVTIEVKHGLAIDIYSPEKKGT